MKKKFRELIRRYPDKEEFKKDKAQIFLNWNRLDYESLHELEKGIKEPFHVIGDAKFPPMTSDKVIDYLLMYNHQNFIGENAMGLFKHTDKLFFRLSMPGDYELAKTTAHNIVCAGSLIQIIFLFSNLTLVETKVLETDCVDDFTLIFDPNEKFYPLREQNVYKCGIIVAKEVEQKPIN